QGGGITWVPDPKKAKIFAKKKGEEKADDKPDADQSPERERGGEGDAAPAPVEKAGLPDAPPGSFLAELAKWEGAEPPLKSEADADRLAAALAGVPYVVTKIEQKDRPERAPATFTTSSLQQQAYLR